MLYISISLTLLTMLAGIHILNKLKSSDNNGLLSKLTWLVILVALGLLVCQLTRGVQRMFGHHDGAKHEMMFMMDGDGMHSSQHMMKKRIKGGNGMQMMEWHSKGGMQCGGSMCEGYGGCDEKVCEEMGCEGKSGCMGSNSKCGNDCHKGKHATCHVTKEGDTVRVEKKVIIEKK